MTGAEYQNAIKTCAMAARIMATLEIDKLLESISKADAVAPLVDPTLWMQKRDAMLQDRELLNAARPLWEWGKKTLERMEAEGKL